MMNMLSQSRPHLKNRTVPLLMLGALGAVLFVCASALIFYRNSQHLLSSHRAEDHSQQVLNSMQAAAQRLERIESRTRLYLIEKDKDDLNAVQSGAVQLDSGLAQLEEAVWDNGQRRRAGNAHLCAQQLVQQIEDLIVLPTTTAADRTSLSGKVLECRDIVSRMQVEEAVLLNQRGSEERQNLSRSLIAGSVFLIVSLAVVLSLFGFLVRDARRRIKIEEEISHTNVRLHSMVHTLEKQAQDERLLTSLRQELQLCTTPAEVQRTAVRHIAQVLPSARISLFASIESRQALELAATSANQAMMHNEFPFSACCALRASRSRRHKTGVSEVECAHFLDVPPKDYLCVPLAAHGRTLGVLSVSCDETSDAAQLDIHTGILERLSEMSSMWLAGLNLLQHLENESIRDALTNLFNRRYMEISLSRELRLATRNVNPLSLFMLDIDHFKRLNDTFGHEAGDEVLRGVSEILTGSVRSVDIACRYGGEEFLVILPVTEAETALLRAEDIRRRVGSMRLASQGKTLKDITVSIGVSTFPQAGRTVEDLVGAADRALYAAKIGGRNRVNLAESVIPV
jgi:diguanylate cyclase (GGDEF)-like protein